MTDHDSLMDSAESYHNAAVASRVTANACRWWQFLRRRDSLDEADRFDACAKAILLGLRVPVEPEGARLVRTAESVTEAVHELIAATEGQPVPDTILLPGTPRGLLTWCRLTWINYRFRRGQQ